jgi:hypothetical protein
MASGEPRDVTGYLVKGYTKCHVVLLALDKRRLPFSTALCISVA